MNNLLIYASTHHGNTKEIAQEINSELNGKLVDFTEVIKEDVRNANLIGFGSGIYMGDFHKTLLEFVEELPAMEDKKAFLFSTSGMIQTKFFNNGHKDIKKLLKEKGFEVIDEFKCRGYDTNGYLELIGGISKGRPNEKDKKKAREFAKNIKNKLN